MEEDQLASYWEELSNKGENQEDNIVRGLTQPSLSVKSGQMEWGWKGVIWFDKWQNTGDIKWPSSLMWHEVKPDCSLWVGKEEKNGKEETFTISLRNVAEERRREAEWHLQWDKEFNIRFLFFSFFPFLFSFVLLFLMLERLKLNYRLWGRHLPRKARGELIDGVRSYRGIIPRARDVRCNHLFYHWRRIS